MVAGGIIRWVRPYVLEAADGILTSAGISEGLAGAEVRLSVLVFAAGAGLVAGSLALGVTEYDKMSAERDLQEAQLEDERRQLETSPEAELEELTQAYIERGLTPELAREVALQLTAHDALRAHAEAEYGISDAKKISPMSAALAAATSFATGALIPLLAMLLIPGATRPLVTFVVVVAALALTGWFSARISGVHPTLPIARTAGTGVVAMAITYLGGRLLHP